ncbi:MAG TPA: YezD family protein [Negativicutes bacterium]|jgi:hypothetical protein
MPKSSKKPAAIKSDDIISPEVMTRVEMVIASAFHGSVTLIVQDSRIIQIEKHEKFRLCDFMNATNLETPSHNAKDDAQFTMICKGIMEAFQGLKYGQIVIVIKSGKVVQIERTEKQRFPGLEGINGDGI